MFYIWLMYFQFLVFTLCPKLVTSSSSSRLIYSNNTQPGVWEENNQLLLTHKLTSVPRIFSLVCKTFIDATAFNISIKIFKYICTSFCLYIWPTLTFLGITQLNLGSLLSDKFDGCLICGGSDLSQTPSMKKA